MSMTVADSIAVLEERLVTASPKVKVAVEKQLANLRKLDPTTSVEGATQSRVVATASMRTEFTVKCRWSKCEVTRTGNREQLSGWIYCDDHKDRSNRVTASPSQVIFVLELFLRRCEEQHVPASKATTLAESIIAGMQAQLAAEAESTAATAS